MNKHHPRFNRAIENREQRTIREAWQGRRVNDVEYVRDSALDPAFINFAVCAIVSAAIISFSGFYAVDWAFTLVADLNAALTLPKS